MNRRDFLQLATALSSGWLLQKPAAFAQSFAPIAQPFPLTRADFGEQFQWGVATAAYQIEGAWNEDGKSESVWNYLEHHRPRKIKTREHADTACDFYHRYDEDIALVRALHMDVFRFSLAWTRILPQGTGSINQKGLDFYKKVVDSCLQRGITPYITLYHWDIPQLLEAKGGWSSRDVLKWFEEYADVATRALGDTVKHWLVLNEPAAFTALGYLAGIHAPARVAPRRFLAAAHHATMAMGIGGRVIRQNVPNAIVGTTFSCAPVRPRTQTAQAQRAAYRTDIMLNRLFVEPILGMGYPTAQFAYLRRIENHIQADDMQQIPFKFDFLGLQNYTEIVARHALIPYVWSNQVRPQRRGIAADQITAMDWEISPEGMYKILKQFAAYPNCPPLIITENGAAFADQVSADQTVHDAQRTAYFQAYLQQIHRAQREGVDIRGYFVWTLLDNFEWAEGYRPRFGLVHVDFATQQRIIKDSGLWWQQFLQK